MEREFVAKRIGNGEFKGAALGVFSAPRFCIFVILGGKLFAEPINVVGMNSYPRAGACVTVML